MPESDDPRIDQFVNVEADAASINQAKLLGRVAIDTVGSVGLTTLSYIGFQKTQVASELARSMDKWIQYGTGTAVTLGAGAGALWCGSKLLKHGTELGNAWATSYKSWLDQRRASRQQGSDNVH